MVETTIINASSFMSKVDTSSDCWLWIGAKSSNGYGRGYHPDLMVTKYAHRLSFEMFFGYEPKEILHSCDNRACVKPTHLSDGTHTQNMRDMAAKGRGATAKLTPDDVRHIREAYIPGRGGNNGKLQKMYGVSRHTIRQIASRETWKDVK